jgi:hypothetical protein
MMWHHPVVAHLSTLVVNFDTDRQEPLALLPGWPGVGSSPAEPGVLRAAVGAAEVATHA